MDDAITEIEHMLDETARKCLRLIVTGSLTDSQRIRLAKWMYGCGNQRFTIRERVRKRGIQELGKVLQFVGEALTAIQEDNA